MLETALRRLPVSVFVHLNMNSYCVRDGSGRIVYADDLEAAGFDRMLDAWAALLIPADAELLKETLRLSALEERARRGERSARLLVRRRYDARSAEMLTATARLWGDADDRTVELRFEPVFDAAPARQG